MALFAIMITFKWEAHMHAVGSVATFLSMTMQVESSVIARQLRSWIQSGLLKPTAKESRGSTGQIEAALFDTVGICRARILMALAASGSLRSFEPEASLAPRILAYAEAPVTSFESKFSFEAAVAGTIAGEDWRLEITVVRDNLEHRISTSTCWLRDGARPIGHVDPLAMDSHVVGGQIEAVVTLPVSRLLAPLLAHLPIEAA